VVKVPKKRVLKGETVSPRALQSQLDILTDALNKLNSSPLAGAILIEGVIITSAGNTTVQHKLQRLLKGWSPGTTDSNLNVVEVSSDKDNLILKGVKRSGAPIGTVELRINLLVY